MLEKNLGDREEIDPYGSQAIEGEIPDLLRKLGVKDDQLSKEVLELGIQLAEALGIPDEKIKQATSSSADNSIEGDTH